MDHCSNGIQDPNEAGVDCGGLDCPPCLTDGDGGTGTTIYPCKPWFSTIETSGFGINDRMDEIVGVCLGNPISLEGPFSSEECGRFKLMLKTEYKNATLGDGCTALNQLNPYHCTAGLFNCHCVYYLLFIVVTKCDANLNPIGPVYGKWMSFQSPHVLFIYGEPYVQSFNLEDYLPSSNLSFAAGEYYRVKLGSSNPYTSDWYENTQYMHFWDDNVHHNNITLTEDIGGKDVILENTIVNVDIEVTGSNSVTILPNSTLNRGLYTIDSYLNCYSFKKDPSSTSDNGANNNGGEDFSGQDDFSENLGSKVDYSKFTIYPNPNNGRFKILFEKSEYKNYEIRVMDIGGRTVLHLNVLESQEQSLYMPESSKGVYIIQIIDKLTNEITHGKIIVQ